LISTTIFSSCDAVVAWQTVSNAALARGSIAETIAVARDRDCVAMASTRRNNAYFAHFQSTCEAERIVNRHRPTSDVRRAMPRPSARDDHPQCDVRAHPDVFPRKKTFVCASIFLDTEFREIYTFVSCNVVCCSIDV